jgi:hypothetical protein
MVRLLGDVEMLANVEQIKSAIIKLSPEEYRQLRQWYEEYEARKWDRQIENDMKAGKLDKLADKAIQNFRAGKFREL